MAFKTLTKHSLLLSVCSFTKIENQNHAQRNIFSISHWSRKVDSAHLSKTTRKTKYLGKKIFLLQLEPESRPVKTWIKRSTRDGSRARNRSIQPKNESRPMSSATSNLTQIASHPTAQAIAEQLGKQCPLFVDSPSTTSLVPRLCMIMQTGATTCIDFERQR